VGEDIIYPRDLQEGNHWDDPRNYPMDQVTREACAKPQNESNKPCQAHNSAQPSHRICIARELRVLSE
jgi:hypothetical protein